MTAYSFNLCSNLSSIYFILAFRKERKFVAVFLFKESKLILIGNSWAVSTHNFILSDLGIHWNLLT